MPAMDDQGGELLLTEDGLRLFLRIWPAEGKGWLGIVHGYGEHCGRYDAFARWLGARGWDVAAFDLRGHGQSRGRRGHIRRFSDYFLDLAAFHAALTDRARGRPVFLLGHSLGGLVAARYVQERRQDLAGLILSAPFLGVAMPVPAWKRLTAPILDRIWPSFSAPSGLRATWMSHDPEVVWRYRSDPLMHRVATARWFAEVQRAQAEVARVASRLAVPILVLQAGSDRIADLASTRRFFAAVGSPDKTLEVYGGFYHEVLNEVGKEQPWEAIAVWLDARLPTERAG